MHTLTRNLFWVAATVLLAGGMFYWYSLMAENAGVGAPSAREQTEAEQKARAIIKQAQKDPAILTQMAGELGDKLRQGASIVIGDAEFLGRRGPDSLWRIKAEKAAQPEGESLIYLQNLRAVSSDADTQQVNITAKSGLLDDEEDMLFLNEGFEGIVHGYDTKGREAEYHLSAQDLKGKVLAVFGERGKLEANVFDADLRKEKASFKGDVRLQLTFNKTGNSFNLEGGKQ